MTVDLRAGTFGGASAVPLVVAQRMGLLAPVGRPRRSGVTNGALDGVWRLRAKAVGAPRLAPDAYLRPELLR